MNFELSSSSIRRIGGHFLPVRNSLYSYMEIGKFQRHRSSTAGAYWITPLSYFAINSLRIRFSPRHAFFIFWAVQRAIPLFSLQLLHNLDIFYSQVNYFVRVKSLGTGNVRVIEGCSPYRYHPPCRVCRTGILCSFWDFRQFGYNWIAGSFCRQESTGSQKKAE